MYFLRQLSHDEMERKVHPGAWLLMINTCAAAQHSMPNHISGGSPTIHSALVQLHRTLDQEVKFNPLKYKIPAKPPSPELQARHRAAAQEFDDMWRTGDPAAAQRILADAVAIVSLQTARQALHTVMSILPQCACGTCRNPAVVDALTHLLVLLSMTLCWATRSTAATALRR